LWIEEVYFVSCGGGGFFVFVVGGGGGGGKRFLDLHG